MRLKYSFLLLLLCAQSALAREAGDASRQITQLAQEIIQVSASFSPIQATLWGVPGHDGELDDASEAARTAQLRRVQAWRRELHRLVKSMPASAQLRDRNNAALLDAQLAGYLNELQVYQRDRKDYSHAANAVVNAVFTQLQFLPVVGRDGATAESLAKAWADITSRLAAAPAYVRTAQRLVTRPGHLFGVIGSRQLDGAPSLFNGALTDAARAYYATDSESLGRFLRARDAALAEFAATKTHIDAHVAAWPENFAVGRKAYDRLLREEQLLPFDSKAIEHMANDALAHGWAEEAWVTALSHHEKLPFGPQSGGGLAPGGPALIDYYRDRMAELDHFVVARDVITVPAWLGSIQVIETPLFMQPVSPGASMIPPRLLATETNGYYFITPPASLAEAAARLDMNQDFDRDRILSTAAHEVMPGHFLQLSIARRHPDYIRRIQDHVVFVEGWAYYGEEMFVRLGLYGDNLDGRLFTARWERVRGARAIVDIRLASGEWSYADAVDFYARETSFTPEAAASAVAGIALAPGYVPSYTVGRYQIQQLLADYSQAMGSRGSLKDFHDRLLSYGSVPFTVLGPELLADLDKPASAVRAAANY